MSTRVKRVYSFVSGYFCHSGVAEAGQVMYWYPVSSTLKIIHMCVCPGQPCDVISKRPDNAYQQVVKKT